MKRITKIFGLLCGSILLLINGIPQTAIAAPNFGRHHQNSPTDFVYTVEAGDTLTLIALKNNLSLANIILTNKLTHPNLIFPGQQLILSSFAVVAPVTTTPSPTKAVAPAPPTVDQEHIVQPGETLFEIANMYSVPVSIIVQANNLENPDILYEGQTLLIPGGPLPTPQGLTPPFVSVELSEPTIIQGRTLVIKVTLSEEATLGGVFEERPLFFSRNGSEQPWSVIAIHALTEPNIYPLTITATLPDGTTTSVVEHVTVVAGPYGTENIELDDDHSDLLDANLIRAERELLANLWSQVSLQPQWEGAFQYPVETDTLRTTSFFGTRRSYNGGPATSFHGGVDFGGGTGAPLYAPAPGIVVLAQELTVRGNAVLIDHGMGLFSGYWHQSQIAVTEGQYIEAGDLIGYMGATGLVTGPHLHWELRLHGISVDPMQWVEESIP